MTERAVFRGQYDAGAALKPQLFLPCAWVAFNQATKLRSLWQDCSENSKNLEEIADLLGTELCHLIAWTQEEIIPDFARLGVRSPKKFLCLMQDSAGF